VPARAASFAADRRPQILVVEDELLVGLHVANSLKDARFEVLGPAPSVSRALNLLRNGSCDAAVLDINLGKETSEEVALELSARRTPFVIVSGYAKSAHPPAFYGVPPFDKPVKIELLIAELSRHLVIASAPFERNLSND
jgi:DNA-binding NtrC family response regulator